MDFRHYYGRGFGWELHSISQAPEDSIAGVCTWSLTALESCIGTSSLCAAASPLTIEGSGAASCGTEIGDGSAIVPRSRLQMSRRFEWRVMDL